jgi:hypothetical protein
MKRFLSVKQSKSDPSALVVKSSRLTADDDSETCSSSKSVPSDENIDDLTNCPDDELLASASREFSGRQRSPQADWFTTNPWLVISMSKKFVLCRWCREATQSHVIGMGKCEAAFTEKGFNNWKDGCGRIAEHSASAAHRAAATFIAQKVKPSVATQVNTQLARGQQQNRKRLITEINAIIFLMRQGLALRRGKDEVNDNLHQVLELLARSGVVAAGNCLSKKIHLSHDIVNELCNLIGQRVLRMVLDKFRNSRAITKIFDIG